MKMNRKLGRKKAHRDHTLRNLVTALVLFERIDTTNAKAKEVKSIIDRMIARSKSNDLSARKALLSYLFDRNAVAKVMDELLPRYAERNSGFVRSFHLKNRLGDNSPMMRLELIDAKKFVDEKPAKGKQETEPENTEAENTATVKTRTKKNA